MNRFFWTFFAAALAAFGFLLTSVPAAAATGLITTPADKFVMAPGGVDMRTGRYAYKQNDLSIGGTDESGGIAFTRILQSDVPGHLNPFGNFSDNWDIMVSEMKVDHTHPEYWTGPDYRIEFHFGGRSKTFETYGIEGFMAKGNGPWGSMTYTGSDLDSPDIVYTFTAPDGTVAVFRPLGYGDCSNQIRCAYVSSITEPDGTVFNFSYVASGGADAVQLHEITSSRGYALLIEGSNNLVTKACVLNLTQTIVPASGLCPATAPATATYIYNVPLQRLASATRPGGATESFTYSNVTSTGLTMAFTKPGQSAPWLTNILAFTFDENWVQQENVTSQAFADGQTYAYVYTYPPTVDDFHYHSIVGGTYTDALGHQTIVSWDFPPTPGGAQPGGICYHWPCNDVSPDQILNRAYQTTLGPARIVDPLGRVTTADYCDPIPEAELPPGEKYRCIVVPMVSFTDPEGIKTDLSHDGGGNITQAVRHAKPGSGLADIVTSATYDVLHPKSHDKPLTTTDANGHTTTYTYDLNHGGVLTETDPAVNGVTPQERYSYAQRYVWISNGAGGYVKAATPVWVLTQMSFCKAGNPNSTNTGCALAADEVKTTYDYGPDAGPNNLILRGTVVDAGGLALRTCGSYDALGNKISETKPRAGLASCP